MFCIGHSHIDAIHMAAEERNFPVEAINLWKLPGGPLGQCDAQGKSRFTDPVAARLTAQVGPIFSHLGGNPPAMIGTLAHPRPFDFVLPSEPGLPLDPGAELIPSSAVASILRKIARPWIGLMHELARLGDGPIYQVEPPPPNEDSEQIAKTVLRNLFPGMSREVTPAHLRYKLWRLHSELISEVCLPLGIQFVPVPPSVQTPDGYLLPEYRGDGAHGNSAYGSILIDYMETFA